jgi:hypothetical protein
VRHELRDVPGKDRNEKEGDSAPDRHLPPRQHYQAEREQDLRNA